MNLPWVEKYRPKIRKDLVGNEIAINGLFLYLKNWTYGSSQNAVILLGPAGCGKTSTAYVLAKELNYVVSEVNASDTRAKKAIQETLGKAVEFQNLEHAGQKRLILMDEVDGLSGQKDRGGLNEFLKLLKKSRFPIVCTANDPKSDKVETLVKRGKLRIYNFDRLDEFEVFDLLDKIAKLEKIDINEEKLEIIAENAGGDVRAAINELESHFRGTTSLQLTKRDRLYVLSEILNNLYTAKTPNDGRRALSNAPSDYQRFLLYLFDESARQCKTPDEVYSVYKQIGIADLTLARIRKTQDWSLLKHFFTAIGPGMVLARKNKFNSRISSLKNYPSTFMTRGIAKQKLKGATNLAPKLAKRLHISNRKFIFEEFSFVSKIILGKNGAEIAAGFDLNDEQIAILQKIQPSSPLADEIEFARSKVGKIRLEDGVHAGKTSESGLDRYLRLSEAVSEESKAIHVENDEVEGQQTLDDYF